MELTLFIKRIPLVGLWLVLVFLASGLIINIIQLLLLPLWFINKDLFRWINLNVVYVHWCQLTFLAEWWSGLDIKLYGTREDIDKIGKEAAICLCNHRSDIDWLIGYTVADRAGILGTRMHKFTVYLLPEYISLYICLLLLLDCGTVWSPAFKTMKCYMKGYLKFLPMIGFSWWCSEFVFLRRNWQKDRKILETSLETLKDFPFPFWLGVFAEGTRLTEAKHQASVEYARANGLPELKHHLLPRCRGFALAVHFFKDKVPAVYDLEVAFPKGGEPTLTSMLMGQGGDVHLWLRRIPLDEIPCGSVEDTSDWCRKAFQDKDEGMSYFFEHGRFPAEIQEYPKKSRNLITCIVWMVLLTLPFLWYITSVLLSGSIVSFLIAGTIALLGYIVIKILLHFSDSKKGSSFGLKPPNTTAKKQS